MKYICLFFIALLPSFLPAQSDSLYLDFGGVFYLDSITVSASKTDFNVEDFVQMVQEDESLYQAFKNIRRLSYQADNEVLIFNKKEQIKASYTSQTFQLSDGDCRTMQVLSEAHTGNFYSRKKKYNYYTATLFDRVFFTHGRHCETQAYTVENPKGIDKHYIELKKLLFSPGQQVDVPLIGKKMAIFEPEMRQYYDFSIQSKRAANGVDCYVFKANVKPIYLTKQTDKTVIKYLETYFQKTDFQVVARQYELEYYGPLFDFKVEMDVELTKYGAQYVPQYVRYDGFWDIPAKRPEIAKFEVRLYDFQSLE